MFDLIPADCEEHISSAYAALGSPEVDFHSFWQVYNQLRDAVDTDVWVSDSENMSGGEGADADADADELPLNHLLPCVLGENGVPEGRDIYRDSDGESGMSAAIATSKP